MPEDVEDEIHRCEQPSERPVRSQGGEIFLTVAGTRSLTRTAQKLGIAPLTVSKKVAELEERSKVRLISRSTRKVDITEAGMAFYGHCGHLMDEAELAERAI